jgi:hypothetical protein
MRRKWMFVLAPLGLAVFIWIGGEVVMHLWNWNLPALFGWRQITFWQALGLFALCRILFGGVGFGGSGSHRSRRRMRDRVSERVSERLSERWEQMTPEEREKFRRGMRSGCGGQTTPLDSEPRA